VTDTCSKHIDICYHYICSVVADSNVKLYFIEGAENPPDMLTKKFTSGASRNLGVPNSKSFVLCSASNSMLHSVPFASKYHGVLGKGVH
jgi:hypothetical protein